MKLHLSLLISAIALCVAGQAVAMNPNCPAGTCGRGAPAMTVPQREAALAAYRAAGHTGNPFVWPNPAAMPQARARVALYVANHTGRPVVPAAAPFQALADGVLAPLAGRGRGAAVAAPVVRPAAPAAAPAAGRGRGGCANGACGRSNR